ncbi:MAG TPA: hypothetical protein VGG74_29130 [Kofleriaceae bacterium]|jgi:hypothetical protein
MKRLLLLLAASCSSASAQPADSCSAGALGISPAVTLVPWKPPAGCALDHPPARAIVSSQTDLAALLKCTPPAFDFAHDSLLVVTWPASRDVTGLEAFDDGTTVTVVTRSCAHEAPATARTQTDFFVIASASASRNFGDRSCVASSACR